MATEEQKNNQQTLNDLLQDYKNGQIEAAEYTAVMTSRTADLSDALRQTVKLKKTSSELDKQLLGSVKRISDLARTLESPYKKISDVQKDIIKSQKEQIKLDNTLIALKTKLSTVIDKDGVSQLKKAEDYIALQSQVLKNEESFEQARANASAQEKIYADELVTSERALQAEIKKRDGLLRNINKNEFYANKELLEEKKKAEKDAINEVSQLRQKQLEASQSLEAATNEKIRLEESGTATDEQKVKAAQSLERAQQNYNLSKEATLNKELQIKEITRDITSFTEENFTSKEKELLTSFEVTKNLEKEKIATQEIIQSNKNINQTLVDQIAQKGVILDTSIDELATAEEKLSTDAKIYAQGVATSKINKANAEFLQAQEEYLKKIEKRQAVYNLTLGFAEGLLKKLGANNAAIALGLEEGKKAAQEMAQAIESGKEKSGIFGGQLKVLGAGIKGTFKNMAEGLKPLALFTGFSVLLGKVLGGVFNTIKKMVILPLKGAFNALVSPAKKAFDEITGFASSFVDYITNSFLSIRGFVDTFKEGEGLIKELSQATEDIATGLGVSTSEAKQLTSQVSKFSGELGAFPEKLAQNMVELNQAFGTTQKFSDETARSFNRMVERLGFSTQESAEFVKLSKLNGEEVDTTLQGIENQTLALKNQYGVAVSTKSIYQEISKASDATRLTLGNNAEELTNAAFQAKRLGLEMDKVSSMGNSLLEFESSIAKEMEAELLIGRDLNLERARQAALQGDIATVAEEIAGQIGSAAEFGEMNVLQQQALADSVGVSRDELAKMLTTQEMLANTGFDDMNQAQQEFNKLVESGMSIEEAQAKFRQKYGDEALAAQAAQVSYAKQKEQQERRVLEAQAAMADAMMPVAEAMKRFHENLQAVRKVLINQMRPFFKEFGGLIDDGGDAFQRILKEYVAPLGKRLNDIGLTLIRFARENGPAIKQTFMSILDVFGSIYGLVGDIIKELFNIKGTSSVADPLKNALQLVQDIAKDIVSYVKSIDAGDIAEKIKKVITGIGNFYQGLYNFVKGTITTIRDAINYVKENPITTLLGVGAATGLAALLKRGSSRLFPMFTKNVDGPGGGGGMLKGLKNLFSKPTSGTGLTGTSRIINAIKGGFKGGGFGGAIRGGSTAASRMMGASRVGQLAGRIGLPSLFGGGAAGAGGGVGAGAAGSFAASLGPAVIGLAASYGLNLLKGRQQEKIGGIDQQLTQDITSVKIKELEEKRATAESTSKALGLAAQTAKYAGIGATIGSIIPGIGTAVGAGVGAIVGAAVGTYTEYGDDISDWGSALGLWGERASKAADDFSESFRKTQQKLARTQAKTLKNLEKVEAKRNLAIERATRDVVGQFKDLASAGKLNFETVKSTDKGFQDFARQMYLAGNLTEEEFQRAINGVISPMDTLKTATEGASGRLNEAFNKIEGKIKGETKEKVETARFEYIAETGIDPVKFQEDATRILEASGTISADLFKSGLDAARRVGADVQASELLSVLRGEGTNAGIEFTEARDIRETFIQPVIQAAKGNKEQIQAANTAFNLALSEFDRVYGDLDLEEEESSAKFVEVYQRMLSQTLNKVTEDFQQKQAEIEEKGSQELTRAAQVQLQQEDVAKTINANFTANQDKVTSALESNNKSTSKLIESQLEKDDALYGLLNEQLSNQNTSLEKLLKDGVDTKEFITLQKAFIDLSKAAIESGDAKLTEAVVSLSSTLGVQDGVIQSVQDGTALSSKGPFTITDKFGTTAVTAVGDGVVVSPNITHVNDAITNPVTGEIRGVIIPELQSLELDLDTLNAAIGLLQELLLKGNIPSYEGTQAQALLVDYKDGTKDLVYDMERESINIARSVVNTIERIGAAEYLIEIGKQAGDVTETISQGSSSSGSYQNIQYRISKAQTVQDAASISNNGPFTIQDSKGNLAITHPNDKLVVSPNVSYISDGVSGKGGPVFPVSENFGALDVKVGNSGVVVQKIKDGVTGGGIQRIQDGGWWDILSSGTDWVLSGLSEAAKGTLEAAGWVVEQNRLIAEFGLETAQKAINTIMDPESELKMFFHQLGSKFESWTVKLLEEKLVSNALRPLLKKSPAVGPLIDLAFEGYDLHQIADKQQMSLDDLYDKVGINMYGFIGSILGGIAGDVLGIITAASLSATGVGALLAPAMPWMFNFLGAVAGQYLGEIIAENTNPSWMGKTTADMFFPKTVGSLQQQDRLLTQSSQTPVQNVLDAASISHNGPFTIQDSKGNLAITHSNDKLVVSPNVSYVADGTTGKGGPVFPVSEKFGALDVKVGKEGVLVQKVKDAATESKPTHYTAVTGTTSGTRIADSGVISQLGVKDVTASNYRDLFTAKANIGLKGEKFMAGTLHEMGKSQTLHKFEHDGNPPSLDSFIVNYLDGKKDQILDSGTLSFPAEGKKANDIDTISASGNGLLALARAIIELGGKGSAHKYTIGFKQNRESSKIEFDTSLINRLSPTFNSIKDALLYKAVEKQDDSYVTGIPTTKNSIKKSGESIEEYVVGFLDSTSFNYIPGKMGHGAEAYDEFNLGQYDYSEILNVISKIQPITRYKEAAISQQRDRLDYVQNAWKKVKEIFVPQYIEHVLSFIEQIGGNKAYEVFEPKINPFIKADSPSFWTLFNKVETREGKMSGASLSKTQGEYSEGSIQRVQDGALGGIIQYVQDAVAGDLVWSDTNEDGLGDTIQKVMKSGQHVAVTSKQVYDHLKEFDVLGLKSTDYSAPLDQTYSGFLTIIKSYINEAVKGDENALDIIMNPFKDASYETALKDYQPVSPTKNTLFYPAKVSDSGPNYKTPQSLIQQTEIAQVKSPEQVEDGIGFWEVMSNPIGALKHYAVPAVVEGSGHLIEALYKTKVFSSLFKKALHKTPIVGQAMHAVTGALNISHLLHDEKLSKDEIYQEVGKTALITMGGIAGGILGEVAMGALGLATGPGAIVLGMLGGMAGAMLGEIVAEAVADLVGARPVGKMIAGFMDLGHSDTHPTSEPTPNLAMVTPIANTIQKVSDGGALASRGPFTITDKFGATAITAKGDGVVVSPNISYVNDGMVDVEPMNQIATSSTQQSTTVIEQDNSELKKELEGMKQLMSELIKELPTIANRPIRVELDGNKVGESLGKITYRG